MKLKITLFSLVFTSLIYAQTTTITDSNFEQALIDLSIDTNGLNGNILNSDAESITSLNLYNKGINDLTGINSFINLTSLNISSNNLGSIDISSLSSLVTIIAQYCSLAGALDLSGNTNLKNLYADYNQVTSVSFSNSNNIEKINLDSSNLSNIDVTEFNSLNQLDVGNNSNLSSLDVTQNPSLQLLSLESTQVTSVDLTQNPALEYYYHDYVALGTIDVSANINLKEISVYYSQLTALDLTNNTLVEKIWMGSNKISSMDFSTLTNLKLLNAYDPHPSYRFTSIDLSNNLDLEILVLSHHNIENLDLSNHDKLIRVFMYNNNLSTFNIKNGTNNILQNFNTALNPNLSCVELDDPTQANINVANSVWYKDTTTTYSTDCSTLSNEEQNLELDFEVYPIPVTNILNIKTRQFIAGIKLTTPNGQIVFKTKTPLKQLDLSNYNSGLYFLTIETNKGIVTKKVIKQ